MNFHNIISFSRKENFQQMLLNDIIHVCPFTFSFLFIFIRSLRKHPHLNIQHTTYFNSILSIKLHINALTSYYTTHRQIDQGPFDPFNTSNLDRWKSHDAWKRPSLPFSIPIYIHYYKPQTICIIHQFICYIRVV